MSGSSFSVAGMTPLSGSHHGSAWNPGSSSSLSASLSESLSQPRSNYQAGYLMQLTPGNTSPPSQRADDAPIVPTKAKMNHSLLRGSASDFGMDSMFETSRQRQSLADDEDAPPMMSVNDIPNEIPNVNARYQPRSSTADQSSPLTRRSRTPTISQNSQPLYIIVFGYPPDKYSVTAEYFKSLGDSTDADPSTEIMNCFRIGYRDPGDAMRAVRKNGEILAGSWMVGAKWADPAQAEALLGQPLRASIDSSLASNAMAVDEPSPTPHLGTSTPSVGTPIKLAPSTSVFKRVGASEKNPTTPQPHAWAAKGGNPTASTSMPPGGPSPSKGVLGQVSDLIFGW
ncbi:uncharacterized protein EV420DRAFT_1635816 [Desarmillaria tabescens]|uniref:RRM Nup35-type domain-containing protein n=1 Tax=Armillaria tabescens TaxID=1929756 RepID=A0AA39NJN2_ARMTA|nr:uncharacterized protein EV420DRAFT_1635816 [Desarmillaria tabescens]KAK0466774.1 hypothetical protein EV420DRAFT_1635816 [Desarmillaria tabescens]